MSSQSETVAPWIRLAVAALVGLLAIGGAVMFGGLNPALLVGWAFGVTIAAVLILFRRRG
jgi:hypothetical protein